MIERIAPPPLHRLILGGSPDMPAVADALGFALAATPGHWTDAPVHTLRTRPGEWWLRGVTTLPAALPGLWHLAPLTGSLAAWQVSGPHAATLLAMGGTLDFANVALGSGTWTLIARVSALVSHLDEGRFEILVDRAHADYFGTWIERAAERF